MMIEKYFGIDCKTSQQTINSTKNMISEKSGNNGFQNTKVFLFDEYAVLKMQNLNFRKSTIPDTDLKHLTRLSVTLLDLQAKGINVVPILAFLSDDGNGYIIQPRAKGEEVYDRDKANDKNYIMERVELLSNAPQEHFNKFVADTIEITDAGVIVDFAGKDNFFYHKTNGFQFIDLNAHYDYEYGLSDQRPLGKQVAAYGCFLPCYFDTVPQYRDTVTKLLTELDDHERAVLSERNRKIFEKCKSAMMNNGISKETINGILSDERFIPQKKQLGLLGE